MWQTGSDVCSWLPIGKQDKGVAYVLPSQPARGPWCRRRSCPPDTQRRPPGVVQGLSAPTRAGSCQRCPSTLRPLGRSGLRCVSPSDCKPQLGHGHNIIKESPMYYRPRRRGDHGVAGARVRPMAAGSVLPVSSRQSNTIPFIDGVHRVVAQPDHCPSVRTHASGDAHSTKESW